MNNALLLIILILSSGLLYGQDYKVRSSSTGGIEYVDGNGKVVLNLPYTFGENFSDGLALVEGYMKYGFINSKGEVAIPISFDMAESFVDGVAHVGNYGRHIFIDTKGNPINTEIFQDVGFYSDGLYSVKKNNKWGFVNSKGQFVIRCMYDEVGEFNQGQCNVRLKDKWGYIDKYNRTTVECKWDDAIIFSEGVYGVQDYTGHYGFISKDRIMLPFVFDYVEPFDNGKARVSRMYSDNGWVEFYINTSGYCVDDCVDDEIMYRYFYVNFKDKSGKSYGCKTFISPFEYQVAHPSYYMKFSDADRQLECNPLAINPATGGVDFIKTKSRERFIYNGRLENGRFVTGLISSYDQKGKLRSTHTASLINGEVILTKPIQKEYNLSSTEISIMLGTAGKLFNKDLSNFDLALCLLDYNISSAGNESLNAKIVSASLNVLRSRNEKFNSVNYFMNSLRQEIINQGNSDLQQFHNLLSAIECLLRK